MSLQFRPHHFLCALCYQGKGYSSAFVENFDQVMQQLRGPAGEHTTIEVVQHTDRICSSCPQKRGQRCVDQAKIHAIDHQHYHALRLDELEPATQGTAFVAKPQLTWGEAKQRIREQIKPDDLTRICKGCSWLALGICQRAVMDFLHDEEIT